jgi:hypothetical protein
MERHVAESIRDAKLTGRSIVFAWGKRKGERPFMAQPAGDRKVRMFECADYAAVVSRLRADTVAAVEAVLRRITLTKPRDGQWERSYRALQAEATCDRRYGPQSSGARRCCGGPGSSRPLDGALGLSTKGLHTANHIQSLRTVSLVSSVP